MKIASQQLMGGVGQMHVYGVFNWLNRLFSRRGCGKKNHDWEYRGFALDSGKLFRFRKCRMLVGSKADFLDFDNDV